MQREVPTEIRTKDHRKDNNLSGRSSGANMDTGTGTGTGNRTSLVAGVPKEGLGFSLSQGGYARNSIIDIVPDKWQSDILDETGQEVADTSGKDFNETRLGLLLNFIEPIIIFFIAANGIMMGVATFDFVTDDPEVFEVFEKVDRIFLIIFTVEIILVTVHYLRLDRITASESTIGIKSGDIALIKSCTDGQMKRIHFKPLSNKERKQRMANLPWIIFDGSIVILSWAFSEMSVVRSFRILRTLRIISKFGPMRRIIGGLFAVSRRIMTVTWLLALLFAVFGVLFSELFGDLYERGLTSWDYFGNFSLSCLSMFQMMCFDQWHEIARATMDVYPWSWPLFVLWVVISGFIFMNFIIAIICDSLPDSERIDKQGSSDESILEMERAQQAYKDHKFSQIHWLLDEVQTEQQELLETVEELGGIVAHIMEHDLGKKPKFPSPGFDRRKNNIFFGYNYS